MQVISDPTSDGDEVPDDESSGEVFNALDAIGSSGVQDLLWAIAVFAVSIFVGRFARRFIARMIGGADGANALLGDLVGRFVFYLITMFGLVYALETLGVAIGPVLGALGLLGVAAAFATQHISENFISGVMLQIRSPFMKGDEIETNGFRGTVLGVESRSMTMQTLAGETVKIPNSSVLNNPIVNLSTLGMLRNTVVVGVAYGTDVAHAANILREAIAPVDGVYDDPPVFVTASGFESSSIDFKCRYWHKGTLNERARTRDLVIAAISDALHEAGIEIPFPQRVLHIADDNAIERNGERSALSRISDAA